VAPQTESQRKAAAHKAAATRRRNQAQRVADTAVGSALIAGENVAGATRDPQRRFERFQRKVAAEMKRVERRGARA
jgi:hypothetical protein